MDRTETLRSVPQDDVENVRRGFERGGATVETHDNGDGTVDITATFPATVPED